MHLSSFGGGFPHAKGNELMAISPDGRLLEIKRLVAGPGLKITHEHGAILIELDPAPSPSPSPSPAQS